MSPGFILPEPLVAIPGLRFRQTGAQMGSIPSLHGIYRIRCVPMSMSYVGQAYDLAARCLQHQVELRSRCHTNGRLQAAYNKTGPRAFLFEVLEIWTGPWRPDCLSPAEQRWMDAHGQAHLFNMRPAGSDEWLRVTGRAWTPRGKSGVSSPSASDRPQPQHGQSRPQHGQSRPLGRGASQHDTTDRDWRRKLGNYLGKPKKKP